MKKLILNIQLFAEAPTGVEGGGAVETPTPDVTTPEATPQPEVVTPTNPFPTVEDKQEVKEEKTEAPEVNEPEKFDPLNFNPENEKVMSNFDPTPFADMQGVNVDSPDFAKLINHFSEMGVVDPKVQRNLVEFMQKNYLDQKAAEYRTPEQIKKNLIENLSPEVMGRYGETAGIIQGALKGTPYEEVWQGIMEEPEYVEIADYIIQHLRPQVSKMSSSTSMRPASSLTSVEAVQKANQEIAKEIRVNGYCSNEKRNAILKETINTLSGTELQKFKDRFSLD